MSTHPALLYSLLLRFPFLCYLDLYQLNRLIWCEHRKVHLASINLLAVKHTNKQIIVLGGIGLYIKGILRKHDFDNNKKP